MSPLFLIDIRNPPVFQSLSDRLSPDGGTEFTDRNEESLVFRLTYGRFSMLLTGDMETSGEETLLTSGVENCNVVAGSPIEVSGTGALTTHATNLVKLQGWLPEQREEFIEKLSPSVTILSYGRKNRYGHPAEKVRKRLLEHGSKIYETGLSGAVMVRTGGKKLKIKTMLPLDTD